MIRDRYCFAMLPSNNCSELNRNGVQKLYFRELVFRVVLSGNDPDLIYKSGLPHSSESLFFASELSCRFVSGATSYFLFLRGCSFAEWQCG